MTTTSCTIEMIQFLITRYRLCKINVNKPELCQAGQAHGVLLLFDALLALFVTPLGRHQLQ